ncbi:uncharacterized protein LOC127747591 [Arachis duranensis]|uniref:Uncharacterized protein LOC127747591 n=1 Tax=Arachis duranensis TaxID=130453 RepID=A0A9C6TJA8_ARADU|nr:uncharacterized protein LOC127747591 [Arachis duranensis]
MLSEVEQAFVVVLEDLWRKPPHLDTKRFLSDPSLVWAALEMSKNNDSMKAFKKAKKATAALNISAKAAGEGSSQVPVKPPVPSSPGPRKAIPIPWVRLVDPPQSSAAAPGAPPCKKQKELMHLREDLETARVNYGELQGHLVGSVTAASENLMEQFRVVAPDADLTLISLDNVVRDGKIVPDDQDDDEADPPPVPSLKVSTSSVPPVTSDPNCQILNRDDGTVDAVPLQTRPPSPCPDAAKKAPDVC